MAADVAGEEGRDDTVVSRRSEDEDEDGDVWATVKVTPKRTLCSELLHLGSLCTMLSHGRITNSIDFHIFI